MNFGLHLPNFGAFSEPRALSELAAVAERNGWDGIFLWDHLIWNRPSDQPVTNVWVALAAMAMTTSRITLGTLITPLARRKPWELSRELVTLDHLSHGRMVLGVGLGEDGMREYSGFMESADDPTHAEQLDEGLEIITGLWSGEPVTFEGRHYQVAEVRMLPGPYQRSRIPIWGAGTWPLRRPFARAARWDGVAPVAASGPLEPMDIAAVGAYVARRRRDPRRPFDIVRLGPIPRRGEQGRRLAAFAEAGATWLVESLEELNGEDTARAVSRVVEGPLRE